jgi:parallel beta-helix repeat protein
VATPPADPADKRNISKYVNVTDVTADSWLFLNVSYEEGDLGGVDENSLSMWKHNGTDWTEVPGTNGVNTAENYVYANITEFGSIFAPLGNPSVPVNCTCGDICVNETGWWRDGGDFNTSNTPIQHAIDNATAGDTICVMDGTYMENVVINKSITLKAGSSPVIDGMGDIGITVEANDTVVQDMAVINSSTGIFVYNASFIIQNVTLNNNTIYDCIYSPGNGIEFWDVNNSVINGSYIYNNSWDGIHLEFSSNNNITSNEIYNNSKGIYMFYSNNNTMDTNNVSYNINCGIELGPFTPNSYNNISNNNIHHNGQYGIYFHYSEIYNTIYKNTISNHSYGIYMEHVDNNVYNNTEDGIYLEFNSNYNTIADNNVSENNNGIALSTVAPNNYNDIINNTVNSNKKYGIYLKNGERHNNITDNTVSENEVGICLEDAHHNLIKDNNITDNEHGILINQSSSNTLERNMIMNNTEWDTGVHITEGSDYNEIHENCFYNNEPQAYDDGHDNDWDYNFWSDYPQWGEYNIPGAAGSKDNHTLRECGGSSQPPQPAAVPALTPLGIIALVGLLSVVLAMSISIRRKK